MTQETIIFEKQNEPQILARLKEIAKDLERGYSTDASKRDFLTKAKEYFESQMPKSSAFLDPGVLVNRYLAIACEKPKAQYGYGRGDINLISNHVERGISVEVRLNIEEAERLSELLLDAVDLMRKGRNLAVVNEVIEKSQRRRY